MNNLTPRLQQVLALASKLAEKHGHSYVGMDHVLLTLLGPRAPDHALLSAAPTERAAMYTKCLAQWEAEQKPKEIVEVTAAETKVAMLIAALERAVFEFKKT